MKSFEGKSHIAADPEVVWDVQRNLAAWAQWDPNVAKAEGSLAEGGQITLHTRRPGESKIRKFKLKVIEWAPPHRLVLAGGMPLGLFTGTQTHLTEPDAEGGTDFVIRETFTGPFAKMFKIPDLQPGFEAFAAGLKASVESNR